MQLTTVQIKHGIIAHSVFQHGTWNVVSLQWHGFDVSVVSCLGSLFCWMLNTLRFADLMFASDGFLAMSKSFLSSCKFCGALSYLEDNDKKMHLNVLCLGRLRCGPGVCLQNWTIDEFTNFR